jgi:NADH-quinone oxidoreductase subunit K
MLPTNGYVLLSAFLFATGLYGVLSRRTPLTLFMAVELMFNAANVALTAYARRWGNLEGQIIALFVITIAAAEVVVGLALIVRLSQRSTVADPITELEEMLETDAYDQPAAD